MYLQAYLPSFSIYSLLVCLLVISYYIAHLRPRWFHTIKSLGAFRKNVSKVAHRGSRLEGIVENTRASFKDAIKAGVDVIELDVWLSQDKKVIVFHDDNFSRLTANKRYESPKEMKYEDFPSLYPSLGQSGRLGMFPRREWSKVPLLAEILAMTPSHVCMIIEFKQDSDELIAEVRRLVEESDRLDKTFWFSLKESINCKLRLHDPSIPTICSEIGMLKVLFLHYVGLLPFLPIDDYVFGITLEEISCDRIKKNETMRTLPVWLVDGISFLCRGSPPWILMVMHHTLHCTPTLILDTFRRVLHTQLAPSCYLQQCNEQE